MSSPKPNKPNNDLLRYAGLGAQLFASLGIGVFIGYKADDWLNTPIPLLVWIVPLFILIAMIYRLIKDTSKKRPNEKK